jgi:gluconokinase
MEGALLPGSESAFVYQPRVTTDGGVDVDADWLLDRLAEVIDRTVRCLPRRTSVAGVGISTFWHSLLGVGRAGKPLTPVWLWADTRSAGQVQALRDILNTADPAGVDVYHQRTGAPLHPSFFPGKLRCIAERQPAVFSRVQRWMSFGEYAALRWFGESLCSHSMASGTGLWNHTRRDWDEPMLALCNIRKDQLNPVSEAAQAGLLAPWRERWPQLADVPWFPAWGDGACANIGSGAVLSGQTAVTVGTSSALRMVIPSTLSCNLPASLWRYLIDDRRHMLGGALSEGGNVYRWARDLFRWQTNGAPDDETIEEELAAMAPDSHGLTFLPFLAGERSPGWQPARRATIAGLTLATTPLHILRAGLEAVALGLGAIHRDLAPLSPSPEDREILAGGAALRQSPLWTQMIADALGAPVVAVDVDEASGRGAALLAAERLGGLPLEKTRVQRLRRYRPRAKLTSIYQRAAERQQRFYTAVHTGEWS